MTVPAIQLTGVTQQFSNVVALRDIDLQVNVGEFVAVVGRSGSGKTTLLNVMGTLAVPSSGSVQIAGEKTATMRDAELSALRARSLGFVFQSFHLMDGLTALENVAAPLIYSGQPRRARRALAERALERVGLGSRWHHRPQQLSGGERQRVAIARAIVNEPALVLADEPTGALDSRNGAVIEELLQALAAEGTTIAVITHDEQLAARIPRRIEISDGSVQFDSGASRGH